MALGLISSTSYYHSSDPTYFMSECFGYLLMVCLPPPSLLPRPSAQCHHITFPEPPVFGYDTSPMKDLPSPTLSYRIKFQPPSWNSRLLCLASLNLTNLVFHHPLVISVCPNSPLFLPPLSNMPCLSLLCIFALTIPTTPAAYTELLLEQKITQYRFKPLRVFSCLLWQSILTS